MIWTVLNEEKRGTRRTRRDEEERGTRRKEGQGGRRDEEEGGRERKEGNGGRRNEESEKMKKLFKKMKNEKVAKGRIIGLAGPRYCCCVAGIHPQSYCIP